MTPRSKSPAGSSAAFFQLIAVFAVFLLIAVDSDNRVYSRQAVLSKSVPQISDAEEEIESSKAPGFVNPVGLSKIKEIVKSEGIKLVGNKKKEWNKMVSRVLTFNLPTVEPIILTTTTTTTTPSPTTTTTKKPSKYCGYKAAAAGLTILGVASLFNFSSPLKEQVLKFLRNSSKSSTEDPLKNREKGGGSGGGLSIAYVITILVAVSVALVAVLFFFYSREGQEKSKNTTEDAEKEQQQQKKEEDNKIKENRGRYNSFQLIYYFIVHHASAVGHWFFLYGLAQALTINYSCLSVCLMMFSIRMSQVYGAINRLISQRVVTAYLYDLCRQKYLETVLFFLQTNKMYGKMFLALLLVFLPCNLVQTAWITNGFVTGFPLLFVASFIYYHFLFELTLHYVLAQCTKQIHKPSKLLIKIFVNNAMQKNIRQDLQLKVRLSNDIAAWHNSSRYGFTYGYMGLGKR